MILSTMSAFSGSVSASATNDDLAIESSVHPLQDTHYDFYDLIFPKVIVTNEFFVSSDSRQIRVDICEGDYSVQQNCPGGGSTMTDYTQVPGLAGGQSTEVEFSNTYFFASNPVIHTMVFSFPLNDANPSNDKLVTTFVYDNPLRDLVVNGHNVDTEEIYNSNVPIEASLIVDGYSWMASQDFNTDWSMNVVSPVVAEAQDCVDWEMNYTGTFGMDGEIILHNYTHQDSTSTTHYSPFDVTVTLGQSSQEIIADVVIGGNQVGIDHSVEIVATINGTERFTHWYNFTGTSVSETETVYTDFGNGSICVSATMSIPEIEVASASHTVSGYQGSFSSTAIPLPNITAPTSGNYLIRAGISNSLTDANSHNNRISFDLIVNDSVDVWIREVVPARGATTYVPVNGDYLLRFPYGEDSVRIVAGNIGYLTTTSRVEANFYHISSGTLAVGPFTCELTLAPGEEDICEFNFTSIGNFRMNVSIVPIDGNSDVLPSDNWLEQLITVNYGTITPVIANPLENSVFDSEELILAVAGVDSFAPMPLNYTWKLNYLDVLGYGEVTSFTLPMGEWTLSVFVCTADSYGQCIDANGDGSPDYMEIATRTVRILNRVEFSQAPYLLSGAGISTYPMDVNWEDPILPPPNRFYPEVYNKGKEPLMTFNLSMEKIGSGEFSLDTLEAWVDVEAMIPQSINISSVEIMRVTDWDNVTLEDFSPSVGDSYTLQTNGSAHLSINSDTGGGFMIIGILPAIEVNPGNLSVLLRRNGQVTLDWDNEGDFSNQYFGGWKIYRKSVLLFPYPFSSLEQFSAATLGYHVLDVPPESESWDDPTIWDHGTCLSYLVIPKSRGGVVDWERGNVSAGVWNETTQRMDVSESCVDNQSPSTEVNSFNSIVTFNNNTKLHSVELSWTWPDVDSEGPLTWNLYRSEVDVQFASFMEPLETGLSGEPGEVASFIETEGGLNENIHLERSYVYILIPFDEVGNSDYAVRPGNKEVVVVDDQYWTYHPAPPPPPEPGPPELPLVGPSEWYGRFVDDMNSGRFQQAGIIFFGVFMMNLLLIPMVINKYRDVKRKVKRKEAIERRKQEMMDEDGLDDEFGEMFD
ncbi:MAG: hypothetical protein VX320_05760 [Candidatus Thermoplasmatota archaeon]|nr:hypothetical protein [Candidatus Thermoplasmatota archaeon]